MGGTNNSQSSAKGALPPSSFLSKWWPPLCALASGIALSFCYPRWNYGGLVWIALAPLLLALWFSDPPVRKRPRRGLAKRFRSSRGWRGFCLGWLAGYAFFVPNLSWLLSIEAVTGSPAPGILGMLSLGAYLALFFGLWGAFASTAGRIRTDRLFREITPDKPEEKLSKSKRKLKKLTAGSDSDRTSAFEALFISSGESIRVAFLCAAAWCGQEWLRGWLFTGFSWNGLGVALHENLILIQVCDLIGVTGLSFVIIFCLCVGVATVRRLMLEVGKGRARPHLDFAAAILLLFGVFFYGLNRRPALEIMKNDAGTTTELRVLLIQAYIPQNQKFDPAFTDQIYEDHITFSMAAETGNFDLVVWPESALPFDYYTRPNQEHLDPFLAGGKFSLLVGTNLVDYEAQAIFNAAVLVDDNLLNNPQIYRKIHLVPFGEYIPLRPIFGWVEQWLPGPDFAKGTSSDPLILKNPKVNISPLICFEDTIGRVARHVVRTDLPQLLVNVTNDGWFGQSAESEIHLANAIFRCVELRRPMVRAANTGVTCVIDEFGSFIDPADPTYKRRRIKADPDTGSTFIAGSYPATVTLANNPPVTLYARFGDLFSISLGLIALATAILHAFRRKWVARIFFGAPIRSRQE